MFPPDKVVIPTWFGLISCYVIVKTVISECLHVGDAAPTLCFMSYCPGKTAIVLGYVRALALLLTICLHWHEGKVCVIVCEFATTTTHSTHFHTHIHAFLHAVYVWSTHAWCLFIVFVRCVVVKCDSTHMLSRASFCVLWIMLLFLSFWHFQKFLSHSSYLKQGFSSFGYTGTLAQCGNMLTAGPKRPRSLQHDHSGTLPPPPISTNSPTHTQVP